LLWGGGGGGHRYFVLQDNFLSYYKDEKAFTEARPDGIIYCEQCRVYELDQVRPS
jgi:hypothetical protein